MFTKKWLSGMIILAVALLIALPVHGVKAESALMSENADAARWQGLGLSYQRLAIQQVAQGALAETSRWEAAGKFYLALSSQQSVVARAADTARWEGLGSYYSAALDNLARARKADVARWEGLGKVYVGLAVQPGQNSKASVCLPAGTC